MKPASSGCSFTFQRRIIYTALKEPSTLPRSVLRDVIYSMNRSFHSDFSCQSHEITVHFQPHFFYHYDRNRLHTPAVAEDTALVMAVLVTALFLFISSSKSASLIQWFCLKMTKTHFTVVKHCYLNYVLFKLSGDTR